MTQTAIAIKTTIEVKHSHAPFLRVTAKQDFPEYGVKSGDIVYLMFSESESKAQGKNIYRIVRWSYECKCWGCPCNGFYYRSECSHSQTATQACTARRTTMLTLLGTFLNNIGAGIREQQAVKATAKKQQNRATAPLQRGGFSILKVTPPTKRGKN